MKKTKLNIGAILLIVFVVINVMLSADIMSLSGYGKGYVGTYNNYAEKGAEDIKPENYNSYDDYYKAMDEYEEQYYIGQHLVYDSYMSTGIIVIVYGAILVFAITMLCGKRWGAIGIGASMATMLALSLCSKFVYAISTIGGEDNKNTVLTAFIYACFVAIPGILGWLAYASAGVFSTFAEKNGKLFIIVLIAKIAAAVLVAFSGINQIFVAIISAFVDYELSSAIIIKSLVLSGIIPAMLIIVSYVILAAGIVFSVKGKPECLPEIKEEAALAAE